MDALLFEDFLASPEKYRACEQFWEQLTTTIAGSLGQDGEWRTWIPRAYADGTPFPEAMQGNPIHDGRSERLNRAFRITQQLDASGGLAAWITHYEEEYPELPRDELNINIVLSEESARLAEKLLRKWMEPATTIDTMKSFIAEALPRHHQSPPRS